MIRCSQVALCCLIGIIFVFPLHIFINLPNEIGLSKERIADNSTFLVLTVATRETCNFKRFEQSARSQRLPLKVLGLGLQWHGFGQKLALLKEELEKYRHDADRIILFVDAYDVLFSTGADPILEAFRAFQARILFSAESNCWPDPHLCSQTPTVDEGKRYLNSGLFIGYAPELYQALDSFAFHPHQEDDQRYYYKVYVDPVLRRQLGIQLDHRSQLFQTLEGGRNAVDIRFHGERAYVVNHSSGTRPLIVHTPGYCKDLFTWLAPFLGSSPPDSSEHMCFIETKYFSEEERQSYPLVMIAVFVDRIPIDLDDFMRKISNLSYPKEQIILYLRFQEHHADAIDMLVQRYGHGYHKIHRVSYENEEAQLHSHAIMGINHFGADGVSHYFNTNDVTSLNDRQVLRILVEKGTVTGYVPPGFGLQRHSNESQALRFTFFFTKKACHNHVTIVRNNDRFVMGMI